jgi:hypothetical protein
MKGRNLGSASTLPVPRTSVQLPNDYAISEIHANGCRSGETEKPLFASMG